MIRVLVMANESLLSDSIVSNLVQDPALEVRRLAPHDPGQLPAGNHEEYYVVIIVEEGSSGPGSITVSDLLRESHSLRIITISAQKHHLHVCDVYELPVAGIAQVVHLAKGLNRE